MDTDEALVSIKNCRIQGRSSPVIGRVDWTVKKGEAWLVTGPGGGGKEAFIKAVTGSLSFIPNGADGCFCTAFSGSVAAVSLEAAADLIEEERSRDESEYLGKQDIGRTGRAYICEVLGGSDRKNAPLPKAASRLESFPAVKLCGVEGILDRGLSFMSTGEIRRTLLCRALLSGCRLLVLSNPFDGLDSSSREILSAFFDTVARRQLCSSAENGGFPHLLLCMERFTEIPESINRVLEFSGGTVSFCGKKSDYELLLQKREQESRHLCVQRKKEFLDELKRIREESAAGSSVPDCGSCCETLVKFENVTVGWDGRKVLDGLSWEVKKGCHFLIRGPNGSGKTTILELITGDNMQVFREAVFLFGKRRGTGESVWDIRKRLGIVSYRLHVEYRMVGGTDLQSVVASGFKDSIGLYEQASDFETAAARSWLKLAGFSGRETEPFSSLSYGEQRAVLILRAAVKAPQLLILDEPCHGLDESFRENILALLQTVAETGTTTLLHVTHDPSEVLPCEKNILELRPGETPMYRLLQI